MITNNKSETAERLSTRKARTDEESVMDQDKVYIHEDGLLEAILAKATINKVLTPEMIKQAQTPSATHKPKEKKDEKK